MPLGLVIRTSLPPLASVLGTMAADGTACGKSSAGSCLARARCRRASGIVLFAASLASFGSSGMAGGVGNSDELRQAGDLAPAGAVADNLLLVSFDTTRADRLSSYGYRVPTSPNIDALASRGALFEHAYSHVPSTLPAHSSLMTGLLPPVHGVRCNGKSRLPERVRTLAERLVERGFATGAVIGAFPLERRFGLAQGFEWYDDRFGGAREAPSEPGFWIGHDYARFERTASEVSDRAVAWLRRRDDRRWFLFAHYFDPHWPYRPGDGRASRFEDPYDGEIAAADQALGRLLEAVTTMPGRTLVVFTADHGEGLGDHGEPMHNRYLYDSTLRVPLIVAIDGYAKAGLRISANAGHVDLLPTILDLLAVEADGALNGRSFATAIRGGAAPADAPIYAETLVGTCERTTGIELHALMKGSLKLVRTVGVPADSAIELYDRDADAGELHNLYSTEPEAATRLSRLLDERGVALRRDALPSEPLPFDEETKARLRSLGYL